MQQIWKDIPEFEGYYQVNEIGEIKSLKRECNARNGSKRFIRERILAHLNMHGYPAVHLRKGAISKMYLVHIAVALCFVPNPNNYPDVNHKDGIKDNCLVSNLEWVTKSMNTQHAYNTGLMKVTDRMRQNFIQLASKKVINTISGEEYPSAKYVAELTGINYQYLINMLNGSKVNKTTYVYKPE